MSEFNSLTDLYIEILEKMIDSQIATTQTIALLQNTTVETHNDINNVQKQMQDIKDLFHNGFRSEIKQHITQEIERIANLAMTDALEKSTVIVAKFEKLHHMLSSPRFWISLFLSFAVFIGGVIGGILQLFDWLVKK